MDTLTLNASGEVSIYQLTPEKKLILTRKNTILTLVLDVVARLLGKFTIGTVDTINIYKSGLLLSSKTISTYAHPGTNQVSYNVIFDTASFNGAFDELGLFSSSMGRIASLTALVGSKDNTQSLSVTWTITITN